MSLAIDITTSPIPPQYFSPSPGLSQYPSPYLYISTRPRNLYTLLLSTAHLTSPHDIARPRLDIPPRLFISAPRALSPHRVFEMLGFREASASIRLFLRRTSRFPSPVQIRSSLGASRALSQSPKMSLG